MINYLQINYDLYLQINYDLYLQINYDTLFTDKL